MVFGVSAIFELLEFLDYSSECYYVYAYRVRVYIYIVSKEVSNN